MKGSDDERSVGRIEHSSGIQVAVRDQNSLVFLCKKRFPSMASEFTDEVLSSLSKAPVANGDLYAATVFDSSNRPFVVASFHGDTNGLATIPVTDALLTHMKTLENHKLLFGLDA